MATGGVLLAATDVVGGAGPPNDSNVDCKFTVAIYNQNVNGYFDLTLDAAGHRGARPTSRPAGTTGARRPTGPG